VTVIDRTAKQPDPGRIQDFIFSRELAEVYLLLDHLSGCSDKSIAAALSNGKETDGEERLKTICTIAWPPNGTPVEQAIQASALLSARDSLNAAVKPANGHSIAFTLLVIGDEGETAAEADHARRSRMSARRSAETVQGHPSAEKTGHDRPNSNIGTDRTPIWGEGLPSRVSLAKLAYPGLVDSARRFHNEKTVILAVLFAWLVATCVLSWNIAAGQAILSRLNADDKEIADVDKRISADKKSNAIGCPPQRPQNQSDIQNGLYNYNELTVFCDRRDKNLKVLESWLKFPWRWMKVAPKYDSVRPEQGRQWAIFFIEVLATSVLPLLYGVLGAGVAVVRNLWTKMRDSLLSPRDPTLAMGQLAQGAVIGACIGLFIPASSGLATLTPSALSFIAGFGVEGVFVMLENLVKRVFNTPQTRPGS
jgi:hypothetical protein